METGTVGREKLKEHEQWSEQLSGKRIRDGNSDPEVGHRKNRVHKKNKNRIFHSNPNIITTDPRRSPSSLSHLIIEIKISS
jgi:hypothetical protein